MGKKAEEAFVKGRHTNEQQICEQMLNISNHQKNVN